MKAISVLQLLPYDLFLALSSASTPAAPAVRADLTHVDSGRGFTSRELLRRLATRSRARASRLYSSSSSSSSARPAGAGSHAVTAPLARGTVGDADIDSEYLIHLSIGTPRPQRVALTLDTGSDLVWTQCACHVCFAQPFPTFDALASQTTLAVPCSDPICTSGKYPLSGCTFNDNTCFYLYDYADKSITSGRIVEDTFTFRSPQGNNGSKAHAGVAVPNVRFGCGQYNKGIFKSNESGIAGFSRGPMSLPSQLKVARFSHCFTAIADARTSPVFLGGAPGPDNLGAHATGPVQSTPFANSNGSLYYLTLKGITVGKTRLPLNALAFAGKGTGSGSGGTIIDSGTGIRTLPGPMYRSLRAAFVARVKLPVANESAADAESTLCFEAARCRGAPSAIP
ncbi:aspartic proteinase nepenthesin-1 [Brachypodium distachyon]|uniref:Peptidase A1 domain-containing protein n=1 Tax=Brachypodium distachyon TaxID=15368 RepID=A0A0Q3H7Q2_BRADI|nr:aspartic proteinase nepenthesin-1 [Brachypodium distachyon]KQK19055.1 hypothetical protein BRADI_1g46195v3 [Brachypodium distachyon]KQK19056.1 hypothetical protein BRADI_1g46195v3 [Brachypodium distachyon]PNT76233.1 hypothetical protein BRADI_1g46195v3 [Brachypodium distachyon]|eukprot:XP_024312687.1 aspartic proteinase nepenthesin-1 [Brachypodium distachyon]